MRSGIEEHIEFLFAQHVTWAHFKGIWDLIHELSRKIWQDFVQGIQYKAELDGVGPLGISHGKYTSWLKVLLTQLVGQEGSKFFALGPWRRLAESWNELIHAIVPVAESTIN